MSKRRCTRLLEGLPVVDATRAMNIDISPSDIKQSSKANPAKCAAATACARKFNTEARVFLTKTYVKTKNHWVRYATPERLTREIIAFDRGSQFEPGEYQLKPPTASDKLGERKPTGPKKHTGTPKQVHHVTKNVRSYWA